MPIQLDHIIKALSQELPGHEAQMGLAPAGRSIATPERQAKIAAVLCLFYPVHEKWHIVFIERTSKNPKDKHGGQISFPGGMLEDTDADLQSCAFREAQEEIGLHTDKVVPIAPLSSLYIPVSDFLVYPFAAYTKHPQTFIPQASEVKNVLSFSVAELLHIANVKPVHVPIRSLNVKMEVPAFSLDHAVIWGATAMMLQECLTMIRHHLA